MNVPVSPSCPRARGEERSRLNVPARPRCPGRAGRTGILVFRSGCAPPPGCRPECSNPASPRPAGRSFHPPLAPPGPPRPYSTPFPLPLPAPAAPGSNRALPPFLSAPRLRPGSPSSRLRPGPPVLEPGPGPGKRNRVFGTSDFLSRRTRSTCGRARERKVISHKAERQRPPQKEGSRPPRARQTTSWPFRAIFRPGGKELGGTKPRRNYNDR